MKPIKNETPTGPEKSLEFGETEIPFTTTDVEEEMELLDSYREEMRERGGDRINSDE